MRWSVAEWMLTDVVSGRMDVDLGGHGQNEC